MAALGARPPRPVARAPPTPGEPVPVTVLGPQRPLANLPAVLAAQGVRGPVALISAGWRYDEDRDEPLRAEIPNTVHNLRLYQAYADLERDAPDLSRAHNRKQAELLRIKSRYRLALAPALAACAALRADGPDPDCPFYRSAIEHVREIDGHFLGEAERLHAAFHDEARPRQHPTVRATLARIHDILSGASAVLIAGGHVGILRNRLAFYGLGELLTDRTVIGWSAGAMVLGDRVLLYHDFTPGEVSPAEFLDDGLGLLPGLILLPHARERLRLDDRDVVGILADRLAPWTAVALETGAVLRDDGEASGPPLCACVFTGDGTMVPWRDTGGGVDAEGP